MKRKPDTTFYVGIFFVSFGLISISYGIISLIISVSFGIIVYVKDILFDLVFLLLGFLLIRQSKNPNHRKLQVTRKYQKTR